MMRSGILRFTEETSSMTPKNKVRGIPFDFHEKNFTAPDIFETNKN